MKSEQYLSVKPNTTIEPKPCCTSCWGINTIGKLSDPKYCIVFNCKYNKNNSRENELHNNLKGKCKLQLSVEEI